MGRAPNPPREAEEAEVIPVVLVRAETPAPKKPVDRAGKSGNCAGGEGAREECRR